MDTNRRSFLRLIGALAAAPVVALTCDRDAHDPPYDVIGVSADGDPALSWPRNPHLEEELRYQRRRNAEMKRLLRAYEMRLS